LRTSRTAELWLPNLKDFYADLNDVHGVLWRPWHDVYKMKHGQEQALLSRRKYNADRPSHHVHQTAAANCESKHGLKNGPWG
jgi:succinate dehydrogenase/fumarate reductase flavoprotein subunit